MARKRGKNEKQSKQIKQGRSENEASKASSQKWKPKNEAQSEFQVEDSVQGSKSSSVPPEVWLINGVPPGIPRLCVCLTGDSELSQWSARLLDFCLEKYTDYPGPLDRKDLEVRDDLGTSLKLHETAESLGKTLVLGERSALEGSLGNIRAIGVANNDRLQKRALNLALSIVILLQLPPILQEIICNSHGEALRKLAQEAGHLLEREGVQRSQLASTAAVDVRGLPFIIVSDQFKPMQGHTPAFVAVGKYLKRQKSLLLHFQRKSSASEGEIYFAVIKPTDCLEWTETSIGWAQGSAKRSERAERSERQRSKGAGFILDMRCKNNADLLGQMLVSQDILKVCWGFKEDLEALLANEKHLHLMENEPNVENVLDVQNAFCQTQRVSLSECLKQQPSFEIQMLNRSMSPTSFHQGLQRPFAGVFLQDAARKVIALQALLSHGIPSCSYSKAWCKTQEVIRKVFTKRTAANPQQTRAGDALWTSHDGETKVERRKMSFRRINPDDLVSTTHMTNRPDCSRAGQIWLRFRCGRLLCEPQVARKMTYECIQEQVHEQAMVWCLKAYFAEFLVHINSDKYYGTRFKRRTWDVFLQMANSQTNIEVRLREVKVTVSRSVGGRMTEMPFHPTLIHLSDVEPTSTNLRCLQEVVRSFFDRENLHPCPWGYFEDGKLREVTQQTFRDFITSCWTDTADPLELSVHLQEVFVWFDSKRERLQLHRVTESDLFSAIDRLLKRMSFSGKVIFWGRDNRPYDFDRDTMRDLLQASTSDWDLASINFHLVLVEGKIVGGSLKPLDSNRWQNSGGRHSDPATPKAVASAPVGWQ